jgi:ABC-type Zn uptake system ZnuABC Zn-binding protein ZnuA
MMKHTIVLALIVLLLPVVAASQVKVVTSTSDLAFFAREIGGDLVDVSSIASPKADVHFVEIRPSYMAKVARADIVFKVGLELDMWIDRIIDGSRNSDLVVVDCSEHIEPLEVPSFKADARYGDLHRFGNPHYWLGPKNVKPITDAIVEGLAKADPDHADQYRQNQQTSIAMLEGELKELDELMTPLHGAEVIFYHNSWPYFNEYTGLVAIGFVEPFPGVPPSPSHVKEMSELATGRKIKLIAVEPYFDRRVPKKIADVAGATVVTVYPSVGGRDKDESYIDWLRGNIEAIAAGLK